MYDWDDKKDREKQNQLGFAEVMALFGFSHYSEPSETYPGQYRVIGYASNQVLVTVACEDRTDEDGHLLEGKPCREKKI